MPTGVLSTRGILANLPWAFLGITSRWVAWWAGEPGLCGNLVVAPLLRLLCVLGKLGQSLLASVFWFHNERGHHRVVLTVKWVITKHPVHGRCSRKGNCFLPHSFCIGEWGPASQYSEHLLRTWLKAGIWDLYRESLIEWRCLNSYSYRLRLLYCLKNALWALIAVFCWMSFIPLHPYTIPFILILWEARN